MKLSTENDNHTMHDKDTDMTNDTVTNFYMAQGKHDRQLGRLTKKILAKWTDKDFAAIQATRAERDSAVAALTSDQIGKHCPEFKRTSRAQPISTESADITAEAA